MSDKIDVFGVGNAIVDILAQVPDSALADLALTKGAMTLMDSEKQSGVLQYLEGRPLTLASGGSAANTMAAIAQSGGTGIYAGKVAHDPHGEFYQRDMRVVGIECYVPPAPETGLPTGTSVVLTTPDAERTMCTHLGISATLGESDIDERRLSGSRICYVEGYLWTGDSTRAAMLKAFESARRNEVRTAFTFSDSFLVDAFRDDFEKLVREHCDIVFCNAEEAAKFFDGMGPEQAAAELAKMCEWAFVTDGPNGCHVGHGDQVTHVHGFPVKAIDTVGAGDAFAGGTLYGLTHGMSPADAARWGNYFASRVVEHIGPRVNIPMKEHLESVFAG